MLHIPPTNCLLLTAKQEPYKKAYLLTKNIEEFSGKKFRRKGQQAENDKTERVTGLGRRTREETAKWNQMTAVRFQTGGRHQTSPASLRGCLKRIITKLNEPGTQESETQNSYKRARHAALQSDLLRT